MESFWLLAVVVLIEGFLVLFAATGTYVLRWEKGSRPRRVLDFLLGPSQILMLLATAYLTFYHMAATVFSAEAVLAVWEDRRAVIKQLLQGLTPLVLIILLGAIALFRKITAWGRCPYCEQFPVKREIDRPAASGRWRCPKFPQEHNGPVGVHWWSKPEMEGAAEDD
jgi:hypothetical protein